LQDRGRQETTQQWVYGRIDAVEGTDGFFTLSTNFRSLEVEIVALESLSSTSLNKSYPLK